MKIAGFEIPSDWPTFLSVLAIHVPAGLLAVVTDVVAMLAKKRRGAHANAGSICFWSHALLFATSTAPAAMRWDADYHLFSLGAVAFVAALVGREVRRHRWRTSTDLHIVGMGLSYIAMLTAFYVDNGKNLPIWRDLPKAVYRLAPSAFGLPLLIWAVAREAKVAIHVGGTAH